MRWLQTDFIKNRGIQQMLASGVACDLLAARTLKHILVIIGIPYLTSLWFLYRAREKKKPVQQARISAQYRRKGKVNTINID